MTEMDKTGDLPEASEGLTETGFQVSRLPQEVLDAQDANRKLTMNGGRGAEDAAMVGGELLTVKETLALAIARDMADDALRREPDGTELKDVPMMKLIHGIDERVRGRAVTSGEVLQEIGRLQNVAKYGTRVARR